jgi:hypothetical protein
MVVNKSAVSLTAHVGLAHFAPVGRASVWRYSSANAAAIVHGTDVWVRPGGVTMAIPASSITLLVVAKTP